ncbi:universal stress protein [Burkholderia sp. MS455]|uniref:Nucleotide-binding universal stress UspA family protein n=1 Tax=Burkholderia pyrrocinia TaxID=60550 RepID=A0A318IHV1_BURPY|nr:MULTISPECIES: universal stress protein [Burkholderia]PXX33589.1 nucleotide-binding universal stress UspA family protein [Burkholderia pyrrocinia]QRR10166.1 universal stress protein [Burkholderia sp. MS455]SFW73247.1 Nucleotide-binding universal stress protein, UspA family [Burkholderia sp. NFACC33-1]SFY37187.1 Nucleotide-binding universal stress protein, UspA family [Burkholderia sp. NFPP32]
MYSNILVALDGSEPSSRALDAALTLASESGARLTPVYVVDFLVPAYDMYGYDPSILIDAFREEGLRVTDDAAKRMAARGVTGTPRIANVDPGGEDVAQRLLIVAKEAGADLIVMGTHGRRGFSRLVLGSVAERLLRRAACPVLMIPASCAPVPAAAPAAASTEKEPS